MKKKRRTKKEKEKIRKTIDLIIKIVLIIIIVLLLIHNCSLISKNKGKKTPSGNINIIDIKCDDNKCSESNNPVTGSSSSSNTNSTTGNTGTGGNKETSGNGNSTDDSGDLIISDKNITWSDSSSLDIFSNSVYAYNDKIAPEDTNTYQFIVKNSTKYNLNYSISFDEVNSYNMNLKYRLRKNDEYLNSDYVYYDKLNIANQLINAGDNDTFYLDWKWVSNDNDTEVGEAQANYKLIINVDAESVNG